LGSPECERVCALLVAQQNLEKDQTLCSWLATLINPPEVSPLEGSHYGRLKPPQSQGLRALINVCFRAFEAKLTLLVCLYRCDGIAFGLGVRWPLELGVELGQLQMESRRIVERRAKGRQQPNGVLRMVHMTVGAR
jgi:hypothetical protein